MKFIYSFGIAVFILCSVSLSQSNKNVLMPDKIITGAETGNYSAQFIPGLSHSAFLPPVNGRNLSYNFSPTNLFTGYDLQSNGTPQQIWQDPTNPFNLYMVFTTSAEITGWTDRNGRFLFSDDMGMNWVDLGEIKTGLISRGGFVTINGLTNGTPVAALHTTDEISTARTQIYRRNMQLSQWERFDPGSVATGNPIWPRVAGIGSDKAAFLSAVNLSSNEGFLFNSVDFSTGVFTGWQELGGDQAENQNLAVSSDQSIIGVAYVGDRNNELTFGDVYYTETLDGGLTWSNALLIYNNGNAGDSLGAMRGIDIVFLGNTPYVVFEVIKQDFSLQSYFPTFPNKIMMWSPALNSGNAFVIADSTNIPYFEQFNATNDVFGVLSRPSIGKSADDQALFVTICAATENYLEVNGQANTYYAGYFMYSTDQGLTFSVPEKFTPDTPLRDWRYINLNPVNYVDGSNIVHVSMAAQSDTIPGSTVNSPVGYPAAVSAELIYVSTQVQLSGGSTSVVLTSPNGGENWPVGNPKTIHWLSFGVSDVKLEYTTNGGSSWLTIINSTPSTGSYEWVIPNNVSSTCKVRISDAIDPSITDESNNFFSIVVASVNVVSPNGGEVWLAGTAQNIIWTAQYVSNVRLEYSTNAGNDWILIAANLTSGSPYSWTIPHTPSTNCRVRISDAVSPGINDISDQNFSIVQKSITVTTPNGGEYWIGGSVQEIQWQSAYINNIRILYTSNSGATWLNVLTSAPSSGSYSWTVPNITSQSCRIKISDTQDFTIFDESDSSFTIDQAVLTVTEPNGGEVWLTGTVHNIIWSSSNVTNVKIELSLDNGTTWSVVLASVPSTGIYSWTVPDTTSIQCRIRISSTENISLSDMSDNSFTIQRLTGVEDWLSEIPREFAMYQNYPNPFNPSCIINYSIPERSFVTLSVFNLLGEKIAVPVNSYKEPGNYQVTLNFSDLNSGVYIYKIEAGEYVQVRKMILLK